MELIGTFVNQEPVVMLVTHLENVGELVCLKK
jgi:hypothetical protein